jgi:hypothetical protein
MSDMRLEYLLNHLLGILSLSPTLQSLLDLTADGTLDIADVVKLLQ